MRLRPAKLSALLPRNSGARDRLDQLKAYGHAQASNLPIEWRQAVVAELERYVNATNLPASLTDGDAQAFVSARVREVCDRFRQDLETELQGEADEARVKALLARARRSATFKTLGWASGESEDSVEELLEELDEVIDQAWSESRVDRFVDSFLEEWLEDQEADVQVEGDNEGGW